MGDVMGEESQLLVDGCTALLHLLFGENNWKRWSEMRQRTGHTSFHPLFSWLLDLAEHELNEQMQTEDSADEGSSKQSDDDDNVDSDEIRIVELNPLTLTSHGIVEAMETSLAVSRCKSTKPTLHDIQTQVELVTPKDMVPVEIVSFARGNGFKFHCTTCDLSLDGFDLAKEHVASTHSTQSMGLTCECCEQKFLKISDFYNFHTNNSSDEQSNNKECDELGESGGETVGVQESDVRDFITYTHCREKDVYNQWKGGYTCNICEKSFVNLESITDHVTNEHSIGGPRHQCLICGKRFRHAGTLRTHKKKCEELGSKDEENRICFAPTLTATSKVYECRSCSRTFANKEGLDDHIANKHEQSIPRHSCLCGKRFKHGGSLRSHRKQCEVMKTS